jgi:succinoglycan biosynthesis protein ExoW
MSETSKLAIIVPYHQGKAGILSRCLASIFAQKVDREEVALHVIIVDDASPWPAEDELRAIQVPEHVTIEVVTRNNGGPGAARNSGIDRVFDGTDFIAFIDSDDTWKDDHVRRAINALGNTYDVYVADNLQWEGFGYLDGTDFGTSLKTGQWGTHAAVKEVWICSNVDVIPYAVKQFIAHMSSVVYRRSKLSTCRFDEEQRWGEDDLFILDLLFSSSQTCVSTKTEVELGLGDNIFLNSWSWDSDDNLRRFYDQFLAQIKIRRRYDLSSELDEIVKRRIRSWRPGLTFFMARQLFKQRTVPFSLVRSLLREDPMFFVLLPINAPRAVIEWAFGKIQGAPAFTRGRICR